MNSLSAKAVGSRGGGDYPSTGSNAGLGAQASGQLAVSPGDTLYVNVNVLGGDGGRDNSGFLIGGPGGGESDLRTSSSLGSRLLVAAGGGGEGTWGAAGGDAGIPGNAGTGADGPTPWGTSKGGTGATASAAGTGGAGCDGGSAGTDGASGTGGNGGGSNGHAGSPGGGGGAGWFGGGGGGACGHTNEAGAGGGGGSSHAAASVTGATFSQASDTQAPSVTLSYTVTDATPPTTTISLAPSSPNGSDGWYASPVAVDVSATDVGGSVAETRCALDPGSAPASFDDLPQGPCSLNGVSGDGHHTIYAASEDSNGNKEAVTSSELKIDATAPSLAPAVSPDAIYLGQTGAVASANATDAGSGVASSSCGDIDTSTTGDHTVTCTATDEAGNTSSATIHYTVQDQIVGLTAPNTHWKAGRTVPVKLALTDAGGNRISDADAAALAADCRVTFSTSGAQTNAPQCMRYDATSHQFIYNWKLGSATGDTTITFAVGYPGTDATTSHSDTISITS